VGSLFEGKRGPKPANAQNDPERLFAKIGQLNMELDWLKKVWDQLVAERQKWVMWSWQVTNKASPASE
jgi:hypothetical protein